MTDCNKETYNKFDEYPDLSANIINYLITNETLIWKLLEYKDSNAYKDDAEHPDLTTSQKRALIYSGQSEQIPYRVFLDIGQDIARDDEVTVLRIAPVELLPTNHVYGYVSMGFEIYSHYRINHMSNNQTRINAITQRLIHNFNGQEVGGLGRLYFDYRANHRCRSQPIGAIPFKGRGLVMCNWIA